MTSPAIKVKICEVFLTNIDWNNPQVPTGICQKCRFDLDKSPTDVLFDYSTIAIPPLAPGANCECLICSQVYPDTQATKGGNHRANVSPIGEFLLAKKGRKAKELDEQELQDSPDFPPNTPPKLVDSWYCPRCKISIPKNEKHDKCSKPEMRKRMVDMTLEHPKSGSMAAAALLKHKPASPKGTLYLSQQKGGPKLPVSIGHAASKESPKIISTSSISSMQKEMNLSNNQTKSLTIMLNDCSGKKIVETGTRAKLANRAHKIAHFHARSEVTVQGEKHPALHITNLDSFVEHVLDERGLKLSDVIIRISLDFGQKSLKLSMNIIDMTAQEDLMHYKNPRKTRRLGHFKDSGVQKIFILAEVEGLDESHEAFHELFNLINVGETPFANACDFKAGNILAGVQSAMATYSCLYCEALNDRDGHGLDTLGTMRTIKNVTDHNRDWLLSKGKKSDKQHKKDLKFFKSCIHKPILFGKPTDQILDHIAPGELHIHLGITAYLVTRLRATVTRNNKDRVNVSPIVEVNWVDKWLDKIGITRNEYGKHELNGNHCQIILDSADQLWTESQNLQQWDVQPIVDAVRALGKVVHTCFGMELIEGWEAYITAFAQSWEELKDFYRDVDINEDESKIMYTEKVHVLIYHVPQFCKRYNSGLGVWSEQAGESLHSKRRKHKENYANVGKHILQDKELWALIDFNSKQI